MKSWIGVTLILALASVASNLHADPLNWNPLGIPIFQGDRLEWNSRNATDNAGNQLIVWSDMHHGNREIFAQLIGQDGLPHWDEFTSRITDDPHEQSYPSAIATEDGWIIAWIDYRDLPRTNVGMGVPLGGELWVQKLNGQGVPFWDMGGVRIDSSQNVLRHDLQLVSDGTGGTYVTWLAQRNFDGSCTLCEQRINDWGETMWTSPIIVAPIASQWDNYSTMTDNSGGVIVAWPEFTDTDASLSITRFAFTGQILWTNVVANRPIFAADFALAACSNNESGCYVAWTSREPIAAVNNIRAQYLDEAGQKRWGDDGILVCQSRSQQSDASVALSHNGDMWDGCFFAWCDARNPNVNAGYYMQKCDSTGTRLWPEHGLLLCENVYWDQHINICSNSEGGMAAVWSTMWNAANPRLMTDIAAAHINTAGQTIWTESTVSVCQLNGYQFNPIVASQTNGILCLFWSYNYASSRSGVFAQRLDRISATQEFVETGIPITDCTLGVDYYSVVDALPLSSGRTGVLFSSAPNFRIINNQGQAEPTTDSMLVSPDSILSLSVSDGCVDGRGGFFVVTFTGNSEEGFNYYLSRLSVEGVLANDGLPVPILNGQVNVFFDNGILATPDCTGGCYTAFTGTPNNVLDLYVLRMDENCMPAWEEPVSLGTGGAMTEEISLVTALDSTCVLVWRSWNEATIHMAKIAPDGTIQWDVLISEATLNPSYPKLTQDGSGGLYCIWLAYGGFEEQWYVSYAQHVSSAGDLLWEAEGLTVTSLNNFHSQSRPTVDSEGNLIVAWTDQNFATSVISLRAQKISSVGVPLWSDSGKIVCTSPGSPSSPGIVPDTSGGVFLTWLDYRAPGSAAVYASHLDSDGNAGPDPYWAPGLGGAISGDSVYIADSPEIVSTTDGDAVILWKQDLGQSEQTTFSLYGQRISAGALTAHESQHRLPTRYSLNQNFPNPFNPSTTITFDLPQAGHTQVKLFDVLGREVTTLLDKQLSAGSFSIDYNARQLPSGVYIYRLQSGDYSVSRKMILVK